MDIRRKTIVGNAILLAALACSLPLEARGSGSADVIGRSASKRAARVPANRSVPSRTRVIVVSPSAGRVVIQPALDRARPGDVVRLKPGVYRERVTMRRGGIAGKPVVLEGAPGAILDGSEPVSLDWRPAPDVAPGVYRTPIAFVPFTLVAGGKIVTMLRADRVDPATVKDPNWAWPRLFRRGVPPSGWTGVKALALYLPVRKELLVRFRRNLDPRKMTIAVAPDEAAVQIDADRCVVRNLAIRNAARGIMIELSMGSVVERCRIGPVDHGVWLGTASDRCTVRYNEIFMHPYAGADPKGEGAWENWLAHKVGGHHDRYGVLILNTTGGHEIHDNRIHDVWDGIEDRGEPGENRGLRIHHNRIVNVSDDGLEPNGAEEDCRWHDNIVERAICGFRIKAPTAGPLYAYRNIFFDNGEDFRNFGEGEMKPATVFVYHNTCTSRMAISSDKVTGIGTPNYHYFNNLFWCGHWWYGYQSVMPNWRGGHNVYVRRGSDQQWEEEKSLAARLGLDAESLWSERSPDFRDFARRDVSLTPESPARGRGVDLSRRFGTPLPGCESGAFAGRAPDAGAVPFGRPMPRIPRPPSIIAAPRAGAWPGPEARSFDPYRRPNLIANGDYARGFTGWEAPDRSVFRIVERSAANDRPYLRVDARRRAADLRRRIDGLSPGKTYWLLYPARRNSIGDMRIIVRDIRTGGYLAQGGASPGAAWRRAIVRFTAPAGAIALEVSPRTPGVCHLGPFVLVDAGNPPPRHRNGSLIPLDDRPL